MKSNYLQAMGIQEWILRDAPTESNDVSTSEKLKLLEKKVAACVACGLDKTRTQTVFGVGNENAKLFIVGEAPGYHEDQQGKPFVGRAGQLLTAILRSIGLTREEVFIANILKCRPPENRDPTLEEANCCMPFLNQQIELIQPAFMVAVGRIAAHYLLHTTESLTRLRGQWHTYGESRIPLMVSYHPAYLLRNPIDKAKAYEDWRKVEQMLLKN